ncbi:hypothetical protein D3C86_1971250 [compost metagenome]
MTRVEGKAVAPSARLELCAVGYDICSVDVEEAGRISAIPENETDTINFNKGSIL